MKPTECEYTATCPYYAEAHDGQVLPGHFREQYCRGIFIWCGRYLARKALDERKQQIARIERG